MKVCLNDFCLYQAGVKPDAFVFLERAHELGVGGIHYSVIESFTSTSEAYLNRLKAKADEYHLSIKVGMGACNPTSECRAGRTLKEYELNRPGRTRRPDAAPPAPPPRPPSCTG